MASITKHGKSWYAQIRRKGISVSQSIPTKASASRWATQTEADILSGDYKRGSEKTFIDAIDRYLEEVTPRKKSKKDEISLLNMLSIKAHRRHHYRNDRPI
ncbi:MAG: hypothetical protein LUQ11_11970 [Methylococcaceae bacterium]|nr:hypothetical protein [Methylococcaceae bacterium]